MFFAIFRSKSDSYFKSLFCQTYDFIFIILSDPFTREIMKEFHNTDPLFKEYKYAYGEPKESKHIYG